MAREVVASHSAIVAYWGNKDAFGPLQLERDVVILDVRNDPSGTPKLIEELSGRHDRTIYLYNARSMPREFLLALS